MCLLQRGWRFRVQASEVVALDDLRHRAGLDIANLHKGRLECQYVGILERYRTLSSRLYARMTCAFTHQSSSEILPSGPKSSSVTYVLHD